jgi:hypothetical protein
MPACSCLRKMTSFALEGQPDCHIFFFSAGQHEGEWEELHPVYICKKRAKEVENIILSGPQCTPGPEEVSGAKTTDVSTPNLGQTKPDWPAAERV